MRTITLLLFLLSFGQTLSAQSNIFVLVDVSGSGPDSAIKTEAGQIVSDLLTNQFSPSKYNSAWQWSDSVQPPFDKLKGTTQALINTAQNPTLMIMPFGVKDRYKDYKIQKVNNLPGDVVAMFDKYYPKVFSDAFTYIEIAEAKAAGVARSAGFDSFFRIEITDGLQDTKSNKPGYTPGELKLIQNNNSTETKLGEYFYKPPYYRIILSQVSIKNLSKITPTPVVPGQNIARKELTIIKPSGNLKKPTTLNPPSVSIAWQCLGCKDSTLYTVSVINTKNKKVKVQPKKTTSNSASFSITDPGIYKVSVSGDGASAKSVYFEVKDKGGGGGFWVVLLLLGAAILGYYFWNKRRRENLERDPNDPTGGVTNYQPTTSSNTSKPKWDDPDGF